MAEIILKKNDSAGKRVTITTPGEYAEVLFERCRRELGRIGITMGDDLSGDTIEFDLGGIAVAKRPMANQILLNLMSRASRKVPRSSHELSWYDLKQAAGLVHGAKIGDKDSIKIMEWADKAMNEARAKLGAEVVKAAKPKAPAGGAKTTNKSGAAKGGSKSNKSAKKKAASLAPSSMSKD